MGHVAYKLTFDRFYHLQYIHLFRPFLKYSPSTSPLPPHVSPRRICTANAGFISKLMRLYKKLYDLRQICNIAVYMLHSACTIHLLNLPEKTARRDIIHGVKHLEEIAEDWPCARRTLSILSVLARKWNCELPDEASVVLKRTDAKYEYLVTTDVPSPGRLSQPSFTPSPPSFPQSPTQDRMDAPHNHRGQQTNTSRGQGFLASMGSIPAASMQQSLEASPAVPNNSISATMSFSPPSSWALSGIGQPAMPRYYQPYHVQPAAASSAGLSSGNGTRQSTRTPITQYALDGKEWYLKDGVNWQQNFESWGDGQNGGSGNMQAGPGGDLSGGSGGGDVFVFKGLQGSDLDLGDGWDFDSSMTNLDMIPGLD